MPAFLKIADGNVTIFDIPVSGVQTDHGEKETRKNKRKFKRTKSADPGSDEKRCMYYLDA